MVPKRLEVRVNLGTVTLDFTEAVISWPSLEIDADIQTGTLILVIAPGILVSTDDLAIKTSTVKVEARGAWRCRSGSASTWRAGPAPAR